MFLHAIILESRIMGVQITSQESLFDNPIKLAVPLIESMGRGRQSSGSVSGASCDVGGPGRLDGPGPERGI